MGAVGASGMEWTVSDLVTFLRARLDEDEAVAKSAEDGPYVGGDVYRSSWHTASCGYGMLELLDACSCDVPARMLADVAVKREIVAALLDAQEQVRAVPSSEFYRTQRHSFLVACACLAAAWSGHPDYDVAWMP